MSYAKRMVEEQLYQAELESEIHEKRAEVAQLRKENFLLRQDIYRLRELTNSMVSELAKPPEMSSSTEISENKNG